MLPTSGRRPPRRLEVHQLLLFSVQHSTQADLTWHGRQSISTIRYYEDCIGSGRVFESALSGRALGLSTYLDRGFPQRHNTTPSPQRHDTAVCRVPLAHLVQHVTKHELDRSIAHLVFPGIEGFHVPHHRPDLHQYNTVRSRTSVRQCRYK